jgi:hypothetical protein
MNEQAAELFHTLNRLFWILTVLALALIGLGYLLHLRETTVQPPFGTLKGWGLFLLLLAVLLGAALPILIRTLFNKKAVENKTVEFSAFAAYQRSLSVISISAAYVAGLAYLMVVPSFYLYGSVLVGLYGIYSAIPSRRKLEGEMRYYGLNKQ